MDTQNFQPKAIPIFVQMNNLTPDLKSFREKSLTPDLKTLEKNADA
jgi:hypothetical protein